MKDNSKVTIIILFIILIIILSIIPLTVQSVTFENAYGKLNVYPDVSHNIIRQKQFFNATSYLPSQDLDIAFRFNESLSYGGVYYFNNGVYNKLDVNHQVYNDKHWYILSDIYFEQDETRHGYWEYDTPVNSSGKWDMFIKRSSDSLDFAIQNNLFVHLDPYWNSSWSYVKHTSICNPTENYSVYFNLSYTDFFGSNCNSSFEDIRFIGDNTTELYFWIEYFVDSNRICGYVNISDSSYLSVYYGNSIVGYSDLIGTDNVFLFFDGMEDGVGDWYQDTVRTGGSLTHSSDFARTGTYSAKYDQTGGSSGFHYDIEITSDTKFIWYNYLTLDNEGMDVIFQEDVFYTTINWAEVSMQILFVNDLGYKYYDGAWKTIGIWTDDVWIKTELMDWDFTDDDSDVYKDDVLKVSDAGFRSDVQDCSQIMFSETTEENIVYIDNFILAKYVYPEPSLCDWEDEIAYCDILFSLGDTSPFSNEVVSGLNISFITAQMNFTEGIGDSVNVSIAADNGLFYDNDTIGILNETYSLNVIFANFSTETNYTVYVNVTSGSCFVSYNYNFTTTVYNLYEILQIIDYKIDVIDNKIIGVDDELDISIGLDGTLLTLALFGLFFVVGYTINKRSGGILMIFSGFTLIAFEFLVSSVLNAFLVIPLLSPIAILIIILGVRKWLFMPEGEKTKSEGQ